MFGRKRRAEELTRKTLKAINELAETVKWLTTRNGTLTRQVEALEKQTTVLPRLVVKPSSLKYCSFTYLISEDEPEVSIPLEDALTLVLKHLDLKIEHEPKSETAESFSLTSTKVAKRRKAKK